MKEKLKLINLEESLPQIEKLTKQFNELNNQINKYVKKKIIITATIIPLVIILLAIYHINSHSLSFAIVLIFISLFVMFCYAGKVAQFEEKTIQS